MNRRSFFAAPALLAAPMLVLAKPEEPKQEIAWKPMTQHDALADLPERLNELVRQIQRKLN